MREEEGERENRGGLTKSMELHGSSQYLGDLSQPHNLQNMDPILIVQQVQCHYLSLGSCEDERWLSRTLPLYNCVWILVNSAYIV